MATVEVFEVQESFLRVWNPFDLYCFVKKPDLTLLHLSKCEVRLVLCDWSNVCLPNECGTHFFEPYESNLSTNCMTINRPEIVLFVSALHASVIRRQCIWQTGAQHISQNYWDQL